MPTLLPKRIEASERLLLRRWVPEDAEGLGRAVAESVEHLRPWMAWIAHEPMALDSRREMIPSGSTIGRRAATSSWACS